MQQPNCLSSTPFSPCIFVMRAGLAAAFSTPFFGLSIIELRPYKEPWREKITVAGLGIPGQLPY